MSDPSPRSAEQPSLWGALRDFLHLKQPTSLRESIEEAIEEHGVEQGGDDLDTAERAMLRNMLDLSERKARDVAVPRSRIIAIAETASFDAAVALFREAGHSRLPVYRGSLDAVVGMLHVKDIYAVLADRMTAAAGNGALDPDITTLLRTVLFVPPSMPVVDLLTDMRRKRTHMAIIVDEYGGTDGLATIEDIVEEIVGDIEDEHDEEVQAQLVERGDGCFEADASLDLDDLETSLGAGFEPADLADEVDTLGGLAVLIAGRVPHAGDLIDHPNGWRIEVLASDGRRVERLLLVPPDSLRSPTKAPDAASQKMG